MDVNYTYLGRGTCVHGETWVISRDSCSDPSRQTTKLSVVGSMVAEVAKTGIPQSVVLSKFGAPLFATMGFVHNHKKNAMAPPGLFECHKSAVAQTHLWRRQNYPVVFFFHVLWVSSVNSSAYNEHSKRTFRREPSRASHVSLFTATAGILSFSVKKRA
jgi:hypothetical protein